MEHFTLIQAIAMLLTMCGLVSCRIFLPAFLYAACVRLTPHLGAMAPDILERLAAGTPPWMTQNWTLALLGLLAAVELWAMREPELRQFLSEELDKYVKPVMAMVVAFGLIRHSDAADVQKLLEQPQESGFILATFGAFFCGGVTSFFCALRSRLAALLELLDPDNSLGLQTLANGIEESWCVFGLVLLVLLPTLALTATLVFYVLAFLLRRAAALRERKHSHLCPECAEKGVETAVPNSAEICPVCKALQPSICEVGTLGGTSSRVLERAHLERHRRELLLAHRCPACAAPLREPRLCRCCGKAVWEAGISPVEYARRIDRRAWLLFLVFFFLTLVPVVGFLLSLILFNLLMIRPFRLYQTGLARFKSKFFFRFLKILMVIAGAFLSALPGVGVLSLIPFGLYYHNSRQDFLRRTTDEV